MVGCVHLAIGRDRGSADLAAVRDSGVIHAEARAITQPSDQFRAWPQALLDSRRCASARVERRADRRSGPDAGDRPSSVYHPSNVQYVTGVTRIVWG